jgi:serine/threonine protein phosphatase 1
MDILTSDWFDLPAGGAVPGRVFAIGDVHGRADLLAATLDHLEALPGGPEAHLVLLGDLHDRGPEGIRAIHLAWDAQDRFREHSYLPGNHEICLMEALLTPHHNMAFHWWFDTYSGYPLLDELGLEGHVRIDEAVEKLIQALPTGFLDHVAHAAGSVTIGDLLLVHAGIPPFGDRDRFLALGPLAPHSRGEHWSMIREPFLDWNGGWNADGKGPTVVVHGHTVCADGRLDDVPDLLNLADRTVDRRRINLDLGGVHFGQQVALEAEGRRYRFHMVQDRPTYLP